MDVLSHWTAVENHETGTRNVFKPGEYRPKNLRHEPGVFEMTDLVPAADLRGAVADRDALAMMLKRLLDVALVDGYGETVRDEAEALLAALGGRAE